MKNFMFILLAFVMVSFSGTESKAQCNSELYNNIALKMLQPGFTFVKSYRIDGKGGVRRKIEYTCVFSKDTNYMIRMSGKDGGPKGLVATLYDSKRSQLASSYVNQKFFPGWTYKCTATGIYYLTFSFVESTGYCGAAVLGFRR
jgi:hypothetical protein